MALFTGFYFVRRKSLHRHRRAMLTAFTASALFLIFYVTRIVFTGIHEFAGEGAARAVYLSILFSHITLSVLLVPLALRLVYLVRRRRFRNHTRLARWTFPMWVYVSVTGLVVYVLLYQVYGYR